MVNSGAVMAVFERALKLKKTETCLVVTDPLQEALARPFYEYARAHCAQAHLAVIPPLAEHAEEPPPDVASLMRVSDVALLITAKSLSHTQARRSASREGARIASMPMLLLETANRCLDVDYDAIRARSRAVCDVMSCACSIRVRTAAGTDIVFRRGARKVYDSNGGILDVPGAFGNLPEGEVTLSPEDAEGIYVVDASFPLTGIVSSPLTFTVRSGVVVSITGAQAPCVRQALDAVGQSAYRVAEFAMGTHHMARICGSVLEDEKVLGKCHIAVGNDLSYGGTNDVPIHLDGVIRYPTIICDEQAIMRAGVLCLP
jgi:leucyl aminopeptidase (aminopeptidase T)